MVDVRDKNSLEKSAKAERHGDDTGIPEYKEKNDALYNVVCARNVMNCRSRSNSFMGVQV